MPAEYFLSLKYHRRSLSLLILASLFLGNLFVSSAKAQTGNTNSVSQTQAQARPNLPPPETLPRPQLPQPSSPETPETPTLPPPEDLFRTPSETTPTPETVPSSVLDTIRVDRF